MKSKREAKMNKILILKLMKLVLIQYKQIIIHLVVHNKFKHKVHKFKIDNSLLKEHHSNLAQAT